ncbi:hypothetical protein KCP73_17470 [Salmonella enterica subsp. enterica]|nr:hypothetical protein KCP73_17470 [Salmonella enterica subsp. enterica]
MLMLDEALAVMVATRGCCTGWQKRRRRQSFRLSMSINCCIPIWREGLENDRALAHGAANATAPRYEGRPVRLRATIALGPF